MVREDYAGRGALVQACDGMGERLGLGASELPQGCLRRVFCPVLCEAHPSALWSCQSSLQGIVVFGAFCSPAKKGKLSGSLENHI